MRAHRAAPEILPAWGFAALYAIALLCIPTRLIVGPIGAPGTPANLFAMAGLLWWLCAVLGGLGQVRGLTPMRLAFGAFTVLVLLSYASGHLLGWAQPADIHQRSDRLWQEANVAEVTQTLASAADRGLLAFAGWAGILLLTSEGVRTWLDLDRLVTWVVRAGTVVALMGILQYFTRVNVAAWVQIPGLTGLRDFGNALSRSELNRVVATSAHPIELGVALASLLPFALHRSIHSKRLLTWVPTMVIGAAALMSVSRSAIVVGGVAFIVMFLGWPWRWRAAALLALPVLAVAGRAVLPGLLGTIRSLFTGLSGDPSIQGRTDDYPLVMAMVEQHPLFGQGLFTWVPMVFRTIDNQVLVLLLEVGILGTVAFGFLVVAGLWCAWAPIRRRCTPEQKHLGLAASAALLGIVSSYATFDSLGFRQVAGLTFLHLGICGAVWWLSTHPLEAGAKPVGEAPEPARRAAESGDRPDLPA